MEQTEFESLSAERLLGHVRVLCGEIGARPATSRGERRAAEYVRGALEDAGLADIRDQFFTSPETIGWSFLPQAATGVIAPLLGGRLGKLAGGLALLLGARAFRAALTLQPPPYQPLVAQGTSQNVIARIAPSGAVERRAFLVAHLDSGKERLLAPLPARGLTRPLNTLVIALTALAGLSMLADALRGKRGVGGLQQLTVAVSALGLAGILFDEGRPHVEGANDDASGVAVLLGIAQVLAARPLAHTEVHLVFTGCEEAGAVGIESYLRQYAPPAYNSAWIEVDMVGAGRLCYATKQGLSAFDEVRSTPRLTALAAQVARDRPSLGVSGRDLVLIDGLANVARRGYECIAVSGADDEGFPPNWRRATDTVERIAPDTLARAARYVWALLGALDAQAG